MKWSNRLSDVLLVGAAVCFIVAAAATVLDVVLRAVAGAMVPNVVEFMTLMIGLGALFSIPICYWRDTHVAARLLSEFHPERFARPLGIMGSLFSAVFALLLTWLMGRYAWQRWGSAQTTSGMELPVDWLYVIVAVAFAASAFAAVARVVTLVAGGRRHV